MTFLNGGGLGYIVKHKKSKAIIKELRTQNDDLQDKLDEALRRAHHPVKHQGLTVHIKSGRTDLVEFNQETLDFLETEIQEDEQHAIDVCVSRFNARTGTGRLISTMDAESIPFYPDEQLSERRKALLADNLGLVARGQFVPLTAYVSRVTSADGKLKRYVLHGASEKISQIAY